MEAYVVCFITVDTMENAVKIASSLVEEKIVACVNIIPKIRSIYRWEGKIFDENESFMIAKTRASLIDTLRTRVRELHPYEIPEIIFLDISNGFEGYLNWIDDCTRIS